MHVEGPFGEWPGYYAHGAANGPVIRVKKLYYRNDPILAGAPFIVVSVKQRYHGHAQQAAIAALGSRPGNYHGRFVVVVDDDIDPSDMKDVIWAVSTRCDPKTAISVIDGCWSTPLEPAMHPDQRDVGNFVNSRAILNACRPYAWRDRFPPVNALSPELKKKMAEKWKRELT